MSPILDAFQVCDSHMATPRSPSSLFIEIFELRHSRLVDHFAKGETGSPIIGADMQ